MLCHLARCLLPHPTQLLILTYLSVRARRSAAAATKATEDAAAVGAKPAESSPAAEAGAEGAEGNGDKKLVDEEAEEEDGGHHTLAGETEAQRVLRRHVFMHDAVSGCWWCQPPCCSWCTLGFIASSKPGDRRPVASTVASQAALLISCPALIGCHLLPLSVALYMSPLLPPADPQLAGNCGLHLHAGGGGGCRAHHL